MKITVFGPVKNEAQYIGYSIMDCLDYVHEFIYACAKSDDGTDELLDYIKKTYAGDKLKILRGEEYDFNPHDMAAYNNAFNACIYEAKGAACWFKHPDMICLNPEKIKDITDAAAWYTNLKSFAGDHHTLIEGRAKRWKNIHSKKFGLHYYGAYGSENEDMYFSLITGKAYRHYGENFKAYPYSVKDSGLMVNHYCEVKPYKRRIEKMKSCLKTLMPGADENTLQHVASNHPRVTLQESSRGWGDFKFKTSDDAEPEVFTKYRDEFKRITEAVA